MLFGNLRGLLKRCRHARRTRAGGRGLRCGSIRRLSGCGLRLLLREVWMLERWRRGSLTRLVGLRMQCIGSAFALLKRFLSEGWACLAGFVVGFALWPFLAGFVVCLALLSLIF